MKIRHMPVIENSAVVGIVTMSDLSDAEFNNVLHGGKKGYISNVIGRKGLPRGSVTLPFIFYYKFMIPYCSGPLFLLQGLECTTYPWHQVRSVILGVRALMSKNVSSNSSNTWYLSHLLARCAPGLSHCHIHSRPATVWLETEGECKIDQLHHLYHW